MKLKRSGLSSRNDNLDRISIRTEASIEIRRHGPGNQIGLECKTEIGRYVLNIILCEVFLRIKHWKITEIADLLPGTEALQKLP